MKYKILAICCVTSILFSCNNESDTKVASGDTSTKTTDATASESKDKMPVDLCAGQPAGEMPKMDSAMMKLWMDYATPGEVHQMLAKDDGEWEGEITQWMDPAAPPTKSKGIATNKMILGGRYQQSEHKSCFGGQPFEGTSIVGYDNAKKVFVSSWVDNMGTGVMHMEGPWDAATKTIRLKGQCTNPMSGKNMTIREEFTYIDDNTQKMTMYSPDMKGKEFKSMEILLKRKK
jgi:hypothetical protein